MSDKSTLDAQDCAVCLQRCHYPTQLPCGHIFCFLCVKGVAIQNKRCAMCRAAIPPDYLDHPVLLETVLAEQSNTQSNNEFQWYYEGRNGWWKYDECSNTELEAAFNAGQTQCKLLLAGALYVIDFQNMMQVQSRDPTRRRHVKRDNPSLPAKGIAGIKIKGNPSREQIKTEESNEHNPASQESDVIEVVNDNIEVIEIVDDDDEEVHTAYGDNDSLDISAHDHSFNNVIQRLSSIDLQDQAANESAHNSTTEET